MKVYGVLHTYGDGHEIKLFKTTGAMERYVNAVLSEYSVEYSTEVDRDNILEVTDNCNLETFSQELE